MPSERSAIRLQDILENTQVTQCFVRGIEHTAFYSDRRTSDAAERCLERLSEAATQLGEAADELAAQQPWTALKTLGNVLRHTHDHVGPSRIWEIVTQDLPQMAAAVEAAPRRLGSPRD